MPTPTEGYWLEPEHERIPGTTTITGRFKESGGLIYWAWKLGTEGKDYRKVKDEAASIGTIAHAMVEAFVHGVDFDPSPYDSQFLDRARRPYEAFLEWAGTHKFKVTDSEVKMISRVFRFGGTIDGCLIGGRRELADVKTSNAIYGDMLCQIAAYRALWNENHPDDQCAPGGHILRFDKETGDFHHAHYTDLDDAWEAFKHMRKLYDLMKKLDKRA